MNSPEQHRSMTTLDKDRSLAHAVARIGLGINIALHGLVRWPILDSFASGMQKQFADSILPPALVRASAYGIVTVETVAGLLLLFGLFLRPALLAGSGLMFALLFGSCLIQNWNAAG